MRLSLFIAILFGLCLAPGLFHHGAPMPERRDRVATLATGPLWAR
jgi:hypothetical protein